ncbi:sensor histidine kinase [Litchfieldia salsa]|uniref:histidine kinase n=1 Tax=Litchfieldia salsa TaxID=930152 RepID=A0A1H0VMQ6_9BACI|nr:sensor histidine kinase [Litchfieldia salsa]SDP79614.1 two-component system, NarL family, sensor histidine kinase YdfH [Litchfieldia salsa]
MSIRNINIDSIKNVSVELLVSKIGVIVWIFFIYLGTMVLQYIEQPVFIQSVVFTIAILIYILCYWFSNLLTDRRKWVYLFSQGSLLFISSFLVPHGSPVIMAGLLPLLVSQSITIFENSIKVFIVFIGAYTIYCVAIWLNYGLQELPILVLIFFFNITIVNFYSVLYNRQVKARLRMEYYLEDLETAHHKVENLTLAIERQRMARDLHDTLAQGLAGLIMQLEAVDAHLQNGNINRSEEIIQQSMIRARETLKNARKAIDDLRTKSVEETDFNHEILNRIKEFKETAAIEVNYEIETIQQLSSLTMEHSLFIVSECLANIVKHSQAKMVKITVKNVNDFLKIEIIDNGIGFNPRSIGKHSGRYGLLGLRERVRLIGGKLEINSCPGKGAKVSINVPV